MAYVSIPLEETLTVSSIVTIHYFEYSSDFSFEGESHDFWEFLCVDKGEVEVFADGQCHSLSRGDIIFHKPNEFHRLEANRRTAPNLVVVSFYCDSPAMDFFRDKVLTIHGEERQLLAHIIAEARNSFQDALNDPYQTRMRVRPDAPFGFGQMIRLNLTLLLLGMLRRCQKMPEGLPKKEEKETIRLRTDDEAYHRIIECMDTHLYGHLTLEQLSRETLLGRSQLQQLVQKRHSCGVIDLYLQMKIGAAQQMIRDNQLNFSEIAQTLDYSSIHYFSRQFKKLTGMTPSEYSSSIKGLAERK